MRKTAMLGLLVLLAVLAMPIASAHVTMYFEPQDSSVPNGYDNTTYVRLMANITSPDNLLGGQVAIYHNQTCANITNLQWGPQIFTMMSSWNAAKAIDPCPGENHDWIMFAFMASQTGVVEICNLTIQCNCSSCDYCISPLDFTCGISGCSSCPIEVLKNIGGGTENLYPANATLVNGTVACGVPPEAKPDLVVDIIDPKYIFAGLNNSLFATVTNQGTEATSGPFNVSVQIPHSSTPFDNIVTCRQLAAGESTNLHLPELSLGYWTPAATPENITITVTADCNNTETEDNETNNVRIEYRNTTGDCETDTMSAGYCYGYAGDHPMTEVYSGTGGVLYTIGDHVKNTEIANFTFGSGGDTNQVDGGIADIPDGASVKKATLYVHYGWRSNAVSFDDDPTADFEMSIDGGSRLTPENYYTDCKNFSTSYTYHQYGAMVYDVTANVTGNGDYQVVRSNYSTVKGYTYAMSLMVTYNDSSTSTYSIAHGYDRLATLYWRAYGEDRWWYYVSPEDATTTATLPDVDPDATGPSNWFTVAIDTADGTTDGEYQKINDCPWDAGAWLKDGISYLAFDRTSNCLSAAGTDEIVYAQESWKQSGNGLGLVFACLQTTSVQIGIDQPEYVDPQSQFTINITVDPAGNEISAVQYDLYYNTSVVWAEWANPGTFLSQDGATTDVTVLSIDNLWNVAGHTGKITYAETTYDDNTGILPSVNTTGVLTTIHFSAIGERGTSTDFTFDDVLMSDPEKDPVNNDMNHCGVTIYNNKDPVANASSKYWVSNVASKFQCEAALCCCNSHGGYDLPGWGENITYVRWDFGDGQYGTSEGLEECQKHHEYTTWNWNEVTEEYDPFIAYLTVRDDGEPQLSNTTEVEVVVYIAGDTNGDGVVDIFDAACVGKHWGQEADNNPPQNCTRYWTELQPDEADLNNDNDVDTIDAMIVGTNWNHLAYYPYYKE